MSPYTRVRQLLQILNAYVPTSGEQLASLDKRLRWNENFKNFLLNLDYKKKVIVCVDLNVAHTDNDMAQPQRNVGLVSSTQEERDDFTNLLLSGFMDAFRFLYPNKATSIYFLAIW